MGSAYSEPSVLIVEDVDHKYRDIEDCLNANGIASHKLYRSKTLVEAEDALDERAWSLVLLDISMNIAPGSSGFMHGGHANLGGMDILEKMYLTENEIETIIVTGFDYFISTSSDPLLSGDKTFDDLERQAREWIGTKLLACVRYGAVGWHNALGEAVRMALK